MTDTHDADIEEVLKDAELRYRRVMQRDGIDSSYEFVKWLRTTLKTYGDSREARTAKAYGGCTSCYGKGYSTEQQGSIGSSRYTIRGPEIVYNPCSCDRGKQITELMEVCETRGRESRTEEILAAIPVSVEIAGWSFPVREYVSHKIYATIESAPSLPPKQ